MEHYIFYRKVSIHDVKNLSELFMERLNKITKTTKFIKSLNY